MAQTRNVGVAAHITVHSQVASVACDIVKPAVRTSECATFGNRLYFSSWYSTRIKINFNNKNKKFLHITQQTICKSLTS